ncbi:MAG: LysM peptidoglycan-binding domain-containing protein, partial [Tannerella sp.]|nr:LysM peptidoglycan-binding domain-containing protein [Tannerella sp.]
MSKFLFFAILTASLMTATSLFAQDEEVFYHTVERGQTVYSIAKMYDVKVEDIYRLNINSEEAIKAGSQLRIPQKKAEVKAEVEGVYLFHTIQAKETLYGVSKQYGVSGESIIEANPGLSNLSFAAGKIIRIPSNVKPKQTIEIVETKKGTREVYYTVFEKETLYNLCRKFKTTEEELLKLNPELAGGLRKGMTIRIPLRINEGDINREAEPDASEVNSMLDAMTVAKPVNAARIALLLPYNAANPKAVAGGARFVEYYEGMLLAGDSLTRLGYTTELFVFDIGDRKEELQKILNEQSDVLESVSLIIGGVSNEQIRLIADFALKHKKKYVIPITAKNDEVLTNAYVFQVNTPQTYLCDNAAFATANLFDKYNIVF